MPFTDKSMGETIQQWLPRSHVVKTLNNLTAETMKNPMAAGIVPSIMWISGDRQNAKLEVKSLLNDLGWAEVHDLGGIKESRLQEAIGLMTSIALVSFLSRQKQ